MSGQGGLAAKNSGIALAVALVALATVPAAALAQVPAPVTGTGQPGVIPGQYIVVMKGAASDAAKERTKQRARARGGRVTRDYDRVLKGYAASLPPAALADVRSDPDVAYVEADQVMSATTTQTGAPWGLDRIDQASLPLNGTYTYTPTGTGVKAYIIDTGMRLTHTQFAGRATSGFDAVDGGSADDCNGHGTHVSGTVGGSAYGVAKAVLLVGVRVLNCSGQGTTAQVVGGVNWVAANAIKPAVANMSLGGGVNSSIDTAVNGAISAGVTFAVAAGNNGANACNYSPARVAAAITVGATQSNDARASYSNYGSCLDLFGPGSSIKSDWYTSDTATNTISGTSMATPHVTGAAAQVLAANPSYTPQQVRDALVNNATTGVVSNPGSGSPNRLLFVGTGSPPPPSCDPVTNGTDLSIPDAGSPVYSNITISGCSGMASSSSTVEVHIVHTYRGDLVIDLVAPDGSSYRLKNSSGSDSADNVDAVYGVNLSSEVANGTWRLKVQDVYRQDTGYLNSWTLDL
jgi:subtilisin family serine protease